jgi:Zn-finger nucleic acid-binding protein
MKCPKCETEMNVKDYKDVKIDKCPNCKSVFLDGGELEKIERKFESEKDAAVSSAEGSGYGDGFIMGGLLF